MQLQHRPQALFLAMNAGKKGSSSDDGIITTINLISMEGFSFPVSKAVADMSEVFKKELQVRAAVVQHDDGEGDCSSSSPTGSHFSDTTLNIPLPEVNVEVLKKVIEFCDHYLAEAMTEIEQPLKSTTTTKMKDFVQKWYADFVNVDLDLLFGLILAAASMGIKPLLDLTCLALHHNLIEGKMSEEIRAVFFDSTTYHGDG